MVPGAGAWLTDLRGRGRVAFDAAGLPSRALQPWHYTNVNRLAKHAYVLAGAQPADAPDHIPPSWLLGLDAALAVFVNGAFHPGLSDLSGLPDGVYLANLMNAISEAPDLVAGRLGAAVALETMPLAALNTAFISDGLVLHVPAGVAVSRPIHLLSVNTASAGPVAFHPRHLISLEAGAAAHFIVSHRARPGPQGPGDQDPEHGAPSFANSVIESDLAAGAALRHDTVQADATTAVNVSAVQVAIDRAASYRGFVFQAGAALGRHEVNANITGADAHVEIDGVYLACDNQHVDTTVRIVHAAVGGTSRQTFRGVLDGKARGVFQGATSVARGAQKTDANQLNRALLLSDGARIDTKPELEIYADDVKCGHGASAGNLDPEALFYLATRGLPEPTARRLLVAGFIAEGLDAIADPNLRDALMSLAAAWLTTPGDR